VGAVSSRRELLEAARAEALTQFEDVLLPDDVDTREWDLTVYGRMWRTGLLLRLSEKRCEHLTSESPRAAFGLAWSPDGLRCADCVLDVPWGRSTEPAGCACCASTDVELLVMYWCWSAYVVATSLCAGCLSELVVGWRL
jgi:hypothetical protein